MNEDKTRTDKRNAIGIAQQRANADGVTRYVWPWGEQYLVGRVKPNTLDARAIEVRPTAWLSQEVENDPA